MLKIEIRKVQESETNVLMNLARETFTMAFGHLNEASNFATYLDQHFTIKGTKEEQSNPDSHFFFVIQNGEIIGYLKLNENNAQSELFEKLGLEIERIYIIESSQGKGIGERLIHFVKDWAVESRKTCVWLGVWEQNERAIAFYERMGFAAFGQHDFMLGRDRQRDLLLRMDL